MTDDDDGWRRVGAAIADRMHVLRITKAELIRRSHVSAKSLDGYLDGQPIVRADKLRGLCDALAWTYDSIDRIRRDEQPVDAMGSGWDQWIAQGRRPDDEEDPTLAALAQDPDLSDDDRQTVINLVRRFKGR